MKKAFLLALLLVLGVSGCSKSQGSLSDQDITLKNKIVSARDKLLGYQDYMISNEFDGATQTTSLIVRHGDIQYVEYPISDSGEVELRDFSEGGKYGLSEYRTENGDWYFFTSDDIYKLPSGFSEYRDDLRVMYVDRLLEQGGNFRQGQSIQVDTVNGMELFDSIQFDVDEFAVRDTIAQPEYGMYHSAAGITSDKSAEQYATWVSEDISDLFKCSSVDCIAFIDRNGILRGISIHGKGGGSHIYSTSIVVNLNNELVRESPDLSRAASFMNLIVQTGNVTASASTYEEAIGLLNDTSNGGDSSDN